jgi:hypothetical protein
VGACVRRSLSAAIHALAFCPPTQIRQYYLDFSLLFYHSIVSLTAWERVYDDPVPPRDAHWRSLHPKSQHYLAECWRDPSRGQRTRSATIRAAASTDAKLPVGSLDMTSEHVSFRTAMTTSSSSSPSSSSSAGARRPFRFSLHAFDLASPLRSHPHFEALHADGDPMHPIHGDECTVGVACAFKTHL